MLSLITLVLAASSVVSASQISTEHIAAGHNLAKRQQGNLVSGILCGVIGVGLFTPCVPTCPQGSVPNSSGNCVAVAPQNDPNNCGAVRRVCSFPPNSVAVCSGSTCSFICNQGYNIASDRQSCVAIQGALGNIQNCAFTGNACTTPFANSYPTCYPTGNGNTYTCGAQCFGGFYFNTQTLLCTPGFLCGSSACGQGSFCQSTCVNARKRGLLSDANRMDQE